MPLTLALSMRINMAMQGTVPDLGGSEDAVGPRLGCVLTSGRARVGSEPVDGASKADAGAGQALRGRSLGVRLHRWHPNCVATHPHETGNISVDAEWAARRVSSAAPLRVALGAAAIEPRIERDA